MTDSSHTLKFPTILMAKICGSYLKKHIKFVIKTPQGVIIKRRYSDFEWLRKWLLIYYPGAFIPPIPPKLIRILWPNGYLLQRKQELQQFLQRISILKFLKTDEIVEYFLTKHENESFLLTKKQWDKIHKKPLINELYNLMSHNFPDIRMADKPRDIEVRFEKAAMVITNCVKRLESVVKTVEKCIKWNENDIQIKHILSTHVKRILLDLKVCLQMIKTRDKLLSDYINTLDLGLKLNIKKLSSFVDKLILNQFSSVLETNIRRYKKIKNKLKILKMKEMNEQFDTVINLFDEWKKLCVLKYYKQEIKQDKKVENNVITIEESKNTNDFDVFNNDKIEFKNWLCKIVKKPQYLKLFIKEEFNDIRLIQDFDENELMKLGIKSLHIKLIMRHVNTFKNNTFKFKEWLNTNNLLEFSLYLNSIGIITLESLKVLLNKLKNDPSQIINEITTNNGIPYKILEKMYEILKIKTDFFENQNKSVSLLIESIEGDDTTVIL